MRGYKFVEFDAQCSELDADQLQLKWQHYTRALSAASTSTAVSTLTTRPTGAISMIGAMIAGPLIHNASKKRDIVQRHMESKGSAPDTRNEGIYGPAALSEMPGRASAGVGSVRAEAQALDTVTELVSHVVLDGALAKAENKHMARGPSGRIPGHQQQLVRAGSTPTTMSAASVVGNGKNAEVLLKHANTLPTSLGATANGLIASASRMTAEKYPLLKEYISSVATHSKSYMSLRKPGGNGLSPAGRNWTEPATRSEVDSDPLPVEASSRTATQSSSSQKSVRRTFIAELEGDSYYSQSLVSPIGSSISEMDGDFDHGSVSPCETTYSQCELEGDHVFDNLLNSMDETAISEIEQELELAIQEMDDTTTGFEDNIDKRISRTFLNPTDLDTIVRRQSTRYNKRCSIRDSQYSFDDSRSTINQAAVAPLRSPRSFSGGLHLVEVRDQKTSDSPHGDMVKGGSEPPSPTDTILPAYAETDPGSAPEVCVTDGSSPSVPLPSHSGRYDTNEKQLVASMPPPYIRGGGLAHSESSASNASSSRLIMSDPTSTELVVRDASTADTASEVMSNGSWALSSSSRPLEVEFVESTSPAPNKIGQRALSVHNGMKKVGYLGLEPAVKIAVGGSLLLMGVRPSVQRKMLDKAKSKIGMPEKGKKNDEDDDYMDYI